MNIIFLDIDGVFNCQLFYTKHYKEAKKELKKAVKKGEMSSEEYYQSQLCSERIGWFNDLCKSVDAKVVISSTWRHQGLEHCRRVLADNGATFEIIDITPSLQFEGAVRGCEIALWLEKNTDKLIGVPYYDFKSYVIVDDDSDMLLQQQKHFFQTDNYSGLTPNICYKIGRFFGEPTFKQHPK